MPKLYEYLGLAINFFSREHEPIHVHGRYQDCEMKAEIYIDHQMSANKEKIEEPCDEAKLEVLDIIRAEYAGGYKLHLWFSDGKNHGVDFEPFLINARNPMATQYRDPQKFKQFRIVYGNLDWNDDEMSFAIEDLYNNDISVELSREDRRTLENLAQQFGYCE